MEEIVLGAAGAAAAIIGLAVFLRLLLFRLGGEAAAGKVTECRRKEKGNRVWYVPTVRYFSGETEITSELGTEYSQPLSPGTEMVIIYSKRSPERSRPADSLRTSTIAAAAALIIGVLMMLRFWL
ncbi:MAG: hypothetical protein IJ874_06440 [Ruminococcus sp.]|nr:hypothetical protein [Ruminococcus sp.]